jgi:hypothetical protein
MSGMTDREPLHEKLLRDYVREALLGQDPRKRPLIARLVADPSTRRVVAVFDADDDGQPIVTSLRYRVELLTRGGWATLCAVDWQLLGFEWADVLFEVRNVVRQREQGTYPGGPHDPRTAA